MSSVPWLPYLVTDYIKQLKPQRVFEWGSGESTSFFFGIGVQHLSSVEHNKDWFDKVNEQLISKNIIHMGYNFIPFEDGTIGSNPANPVYYKSASTELGDVNFKRYVTVIDRINKKYDLILIDGMARASCLAHAYKHVNEGGCIVLDNTGDRPYYLEHTQHLFGTYEDGWEVVKFMGYGPILDYKWETTIFVNKRKRHYE